MERNGLAVVPDTGVQALARSITSLVTDAARGMARAFNVPRVAVLTFVAEHDVTRPGDIADSLELTPSSVTRHLQALTDAGQVDMQVDQNDRRTALVTITETGREELRLIEGAADAVFSGVVSTWSPTDIAKLTELADRLRADWARQGEAARARHTQTADRTSRWRQP